MAFDNKLWKKENEHPIVSYNGRTRALDLYSDKGEESTNKLLKDLAELLVFRDNVYVWVASLMKGRFAKTLEEWGIRRLKEDLILPFSQEAVKYVIPMAYVMPIVAAFRQCYGENNKQTKSPIEVFRLPKTQEALAKTVIELMEDTGNATRFGKLRANWAALYGAVASLT